MNRMGIEPQFVVEIIDLENNSQFFGQTEYVQTQSPFPGPVLPLVEEFSQYTSVSKRDGFGSLESMEVTINDFFGYFKQLLETVQLTEYRAKVYLVVRQPPLKPLAIPVLQGRISDPIIWDEQKRTIHLGLIANVVFREFGFVPDWPTYDYLQQNVSGQPWPHVFGRSATYGMLPICNNPIGSLTRDIVIQSPAEDGTFFPYPAQEGSDWYLEGEEFTNLYVNVDDTDKFPTLTEGVNFYELTTQCGKVLIQATNYGGMLHMNSREDWNIPLYTNLVVWSPQQYNGILPAMSDADNYIPNAMTLLGFGSYVEVNTFNINGELSNWPGDINTPFPYDGFNPDQEPWLEGMHVYFTAFHAYTEVNDVRKVEYTEFWGRVANQTDLTLILDSITDVYGNPTTLSGFRPCFIHYVAQNRLFYPSHVPAMCGGGSVDFGVAQGRWPEGDVKIQKGGWPTGSYVTRPDGSGLYDRVFMIEAGSQIKPVAWWPTMVYPISLDNDTQVERVFIKIGNKMLDLKISQFIVFQYDRNTGFEVITSDLTGPPWIPTTMWGMPPEIMPEKCTYLYLRPSVVYMMARDLTYSDIAQVMVTCSNAYNTDERAFKFIVEKYTEFDAITTPDLYYHHPISLIVRRKENVSSVIAQLAWEHAKLVKVAVNTVSLVDCFAPMTTTMPIFNEGNIENGGLQLTYTAEEETCNYIEATAMDGWAKGRFVARNEDSIRRLSELKQQVEIGFNRVFSKPKITPPNPLVNLHWPETEGEVIVVPPQNPNDPPTFTTQKHLGRGYNRVILFWLQQYSNTWLKANFNTFIDAIVFNNAMIVGSDWVNVAFNGQLDFITADRGLPLNVRPPYGEGHLPIAKGLITEITINPQDWTISMAVKLPIALGTNTPQYVV